jgi:hypothetical protein
MIIPDLSKQTINKILTDELERIERNRYKENEMLMDYYEGIETDKYIRPYFDSMTLSQIPMFCSNITRRIVKAKSIVYGKQDIERITDERYNDYIGDLNSKCRQLEELNFLLGNMAFKTQYNPDKQVLEYHLIPFFQVFFLHGMDTPSAIMYPVQRHGYDRTEQDIYAFWSESINGQQGMHFLVDGDGNKYKQNELDINPYDILPFTFTRRSPMVRDYFSTNASDVVMANQHLDMAMTELALAIRMGATGGIKWISGLDVNPSEPIKLGIDKVLVLPSDVDFNMTAPSGGLQEIINTTKFFIESVASNNHLQIKFADVGGNPVSGEALKIMNIENIEQREASIEDTWRKFESDRYDVDRRVLEVDANVTLSEDYYVDFPEMTFPLSDLEQLQLLQTKKDMGIITQRELLKTLNPDIDDEELESKLGEIRQEQQEAQPPQQQGSLVERIISG